MAKLNITLKYDDLGVNTALDNQAAMLNIATLVLSSTQANTLISTDPNNALELGGDNKFLVSDADKLLTNYNFSSVIDAEWNT